MHPLREKGEEEGTPGKQKWKGSLVGKPEAKYPKSQIIFSKFSLFFPSPFSLPSPAVPPSPTLSLPYH